MKSVLLSLLVAFAPHAAWADDGLKIVGAARGQIGKTTGYDPAYRVIPYPGGDVPVESGVCTDVVIRALRESLKLDLQKLMHEDMKAHFAKYPKNWGLESTDRNIDHRRVPNMRSYFARTGWRIGIPEDFKNYRPGDLVTCIVPPNLPHIMIVSDRRSDAGRPLIIHNIGSGTREEDRLADFEITGVYRVKKP